MLHIDFSRYSNIVILTGAGVSVASGIQPFRGEGGLWNDPNLARLSDAAYFKDHPLDVWRFWMELRQLVQASQPNPAHLALASLENSLRPAQNYTLITQNIDGLHQKAGSKSVIEMHGSAHWTRCSNENCALKPFEDTSISTELVSCPLCGSPLRFDVVMFGEYIPAKAMWDTKKALRDCDLFISIGTSGTVSPAAEFVRDAEYAGARTIYINTEPLPHANSYFFESVIGKAEEVLPELLKAQ